MRPSSRSLCALREAIAGFADYISAETLATSMVSEALPQPAGAAEVNLEGERLRIALQRS